MFKKRHNFLHAKPAVEHRSRRVTRGVLLSFGILGIVVGITALLVTPFWFLGERVYGRAEQGKRHLEAAQQGIARHDFSAALAEVKAAELQFAAAGKDVGRLRLLQPMPVVGPYVTAADRLLASGASASRAAAGVLTVADKLTAALKTSQGLTEALSGSLPDAAKLFRDLTPEQKRATLAAFAEGAPDMRAALTDIDAALAALDAVPQEGLASGFTDAIKPLRPRLVSLRSTLALALPFAERAPAVLGYPEARNYLFFFQNNTELRPTGGFLGVYGLLTIKDAGVASMTTDDIYSLDGPAEATQRPLPPEPIRKYVGINKWFLRDANWSPDFVSASALMAQFFEQEYAVAKGQPAPRIDGILAIDTEVAKDALALTGPITVDGKTFTAENVVDELEFAVERGFVQEGIAVHQRKEIVADLVKAVVARLEAMPVEKLIASLDVARRNLDEGHVLLAMADPELEALILERDWGGKLKPVLGDYVLWTDANLASLKSDPSVKRTVSYGIAPQPDGSYVGTVRMTYRHEGRFDWKTTRYRTYARVYVPLGSRFLGVTGAMENDKIKDPRRRPGTADQAVELQRQRFGAFISIEPGETKTLEFRYSLAPSVVASINDGSYRLDVEKQPGTVAHGLTLDLDFGKKLGTAVPAEDRKDWGDARYRVTSDLRTDRTFMVGL